MTKKTILILGATSAVARAIASDFAKQGYNLFLASRATQELQRIDDDLTLRYQIHVDYCQFDAEHIDTHDKFFQGVLAKVDQLAGVVLAFGYLGEQEQAEQDLDEVKLIIQRNFTGAISILTSCANYFEAQKQGFIVGISSVAGDRGRRSNYYYGAAKAGFAVFLQGLRQRLAKHNIHVLTCKLGFVDTPMTFGLKGMFLVASPETIGKKIVAALHKRHNVVYLPWFWRYIMLIITHVPEFIFKRLQL